MATFFILLLFLTFCACFVVPDELLTFKVLNDQLPGKDRISKQILRSQSVIDLISLDLLNVPSGTYTTASTEWDNGTVSDILYVPLLGSRNSLPPILIEIQLVVDEAFMPRVISYSQNAFRLYNQYPMVLVFCISKISPSNLIDKFTPVESKPWIQTLRNCDFWAESCFLVERSSLPNEKSDATMSPLLALSSFLLQQSATLFGHSHPNHPTIQMLYKLLKDNVDKENDCEQGFTNIIDVICSNNIKLLQKAKDSLQNVPDSSATNNIISRTLEFNGLAKRKYVDLIESDDSLEELPAFALKEKLQNDSPTQKDFTYILKYRRGRRKN